MEFLNFFSSHIPRQHINRRRVLYTYIVHPIKRRVAKIYVYLLQNFFGLQVIAITGSAGKTTTKEMLSSILSMKGETLASFANIDPVYNIPSTILRCRPTTRFLVLEMGVEYPGEIDFYCWMVKPQVGVITNISTTHTEFFGDERGVAKEKKRLLKYANEMWVLNKENKFLKSINPKKTKVVWFGENSDNLVKKVELLEVGDTKVKLVLGKESVAVNLKILGEHMAKNALAASCTAVHLGISASYIKKGLEATIFQKHRMKVFKLDSSSYLLDDTYNNNPEAAISTISTFCKTFKKYKKFVVFGDMLELGKLSESEHKRVGKMLNQNGIDSLICVGKASNDTYGEFRNEKEMAKDWQEALAILRTKSLKNSAVLVKGSRSIGLDNLVVEMVGHV